MPDYPAGRRYPGRQPTHPSPILREDVLPALRMSATEAAEKLGVSRQTLRGILAKKACCDA